MARPIPVSGSQSSVLVGGGNPARGRGLVGGRILHRSSPVDGVHTDKLPKREEKHLNGS